MELMNLTLLHVLDGQASDRQVQNVSEALPNCKVSISLSQLQCEDVPPLKAKSQLPWAVGSRKKRNE